MPIALLVSALISVAALAQGNPLFQKAQELFQQKDYRTARDLFQEGLKREPNSALAYYFLGEISDQLKEPPTTALAYYRKAYELAGADTVGAEALAKVKQLERRIERDETEARKNAERDSDRVARLAEQNARLKAIEGRFFYKYVKGPGPVVVHEEVCIKFVGLESLADGKAAGEIDVSVKHRSPVEDAWIKALMKFDLYSHGTELWGSLAVKTAHPNSYYMR